MSILSWFSSLLKPVKMVGVKPINCTESDINPRVISVQQILYNSNPDELLTDPVLKRKLLTVYHENMDELLQSMYTRDRESSDPRPYAVSLEVFFQSRLGLNEQLERLMTALEDKPYPNLRIVHDIDTLIHVLTVITPNR